MDQIKSWWAEVIKLASKIDDYKLIAYGILIAILYSTYSVLMSFGTVLKEYLLLDERTVQIIFTIFLFVLIGIDKYQDYRIAKRKKEKE